MTSDLIIENATILTMDASDRVLAPGWIQVRGNAIAGMGVGAAPHRGGRRVEAAGMVAMPGLVNAHTHLFQTLIRGLFDGLPFSEWLRRIYHSGGALETDDWRVSAMLGAVESVRSGVTTILDHQFLDRGGGEWSRAIIDGVRSVGPRIVLARTTMDIGDLAPPETLESVAEAAAVLGGLRERHGRDVEAGHVRILAGPNTPGVSASASLVRAFADLARREGLSLAMHVAESREVLDAARRHAGMSGVVRWLAALDALPAGAIAAHCVHLDAEEIELLAKHEVRVVHNPVSNLYLGDGIAPLSQLLDAGVLVALGTDGAASNTTQDMFEVMKMAALLARVREPRPRDVRPLDVLRMATVAGARAVGLDHLVGSLEVGKRADLILVAVGSRPHSVPAHDVATDLVMGGRAADVATVFIDGHVVLEEGRVVTVDETALLATARERGARVGALLRRAAPATPQP